MDLIYTIIAVEWIIFFVFIFSLGIFYGGKPERISKWYIQRSILLFILAIIAIIIIAHFEPGLLLLRLYPDTLADGIVAIIITTVGLLFASWARVHLGRNWSSLVMIKTGHHLITTGPYRIVRNPMYTGLLTAFIGVVVAIGEVAALIVILVVIPGVWMKIKAEEEILEEKFGEEYLTYKSQVKALIPGIL